MLMVNCQQDDIKNVKNKLLKWMESVGSKKIFYFVKHIVTSSLDKGRTKLKDSIELKEKVALTNYPKVYS